MGVEVGVDLGYHIGVVERGEGHQHARVPPEADRSGGKRNDGLQKGDRKSWGFGRHIVNILGGYYGFDGRN